MAITSTPPWLGGLHGRLTNVYFAQTPYGTQMRAFPTRRAPATPGELAQQDRVRLIGRAWSALEPEAMFRWRAFAESGMTGEPGARRGGLSGYNAFSRLAGARLRALPQDPIPSEPPTAPFFGDAPALTVEGGAAVTFRASGPNAQGVATEILLQPLANGGRKPRPKGYASAGFVGFAAGDLEATASVAPGWYACAYRFLRLESGQETALAPCGVVRVG